METGLNVMSMSQPAYESLLKCEKQTKIDNKNLTIRS